MGYIPSRKIKNSGTKKNTGYFPSKKNNRAVPFESLLERDYLYLLEFDKDVLKYYEQPETIKYYIDNKIYRYTPDFKVMRKEKTQLIEVKPYNRFIQTLNDEKKKKKYDAAYHYCKSYDYEFKVITEREINFGEYLNNIKYLFMYSTMYVKASEKLAIKNIIAENEGIKFGDVLLKLELANQEMQKYKTYMLNLLYNQTILTDLSTKISMESIIKIK